MSWGSEVPASEPVPAIFNKAKSFQKENSKFNSKKFNVLFNHHK